MGEVFIYNVPLPPKVNGLVVKRDDDYIVFINEALSEAEQRRAVLHELSHISDAHIEQDIFSAAECESEITLRREEL